MNFMRFYGPRRRRIKGRELPNWYVLRYDPSTRRKSWISTGSPSLRAARAWLEQRRYEAACEPSPGCTRLPGRSPTEGPPIRLREALDLWIGDQTISSGTRTLATLYLAARQWVEGLGDVALSVVTEQDLRQYLIRTREHVRATTTNQKRKLLRWFWGWCLRKKLISQNPMVEIPRFKEDPARPRVLEDQELEALLSCARPDVRPLFEVAVETGLRQGAVLSLRWEDLDLETGWLRLSGERQKSGRTLEVPLSPRALEVLQSTREAVSGQIFHLRKSQVGRLFRRAAHAAGLKGIKFHDLRKTFLTRLRRRGVPLEVAMELSDHRNIATVLKHYRAVERRDLLAAMGRRELPDIEVKDA